MSSPLQNPGTTLKGLASFLSCRLIALDNYPGVCPVGIGDTAIEKYYYKSSFTVVRGDIQDAAGSNQLYAGQLPGCEAVVHLV